MLPRMILVCVCMLVVWPASAQNLVPNGDHDTDESGWAFVPTTLGVLSLQWAPSEDALDRPDSGAIEVEWALSSVADPVAAEAILESTCSNSLIAPAEYRFGWAEREAAAGAGDLLVEFCTYDGPDCAFPESCGLLAVQPPTATYTFRHGTDPVLATEQSFRAKVLVTFEPGGPGFLANGRVFLDKIFYRPAAEVEPLQAIPVLESVNGLVAQFTGAATGGASPYPPNFLWDFGDGMGSMEQSPEHTYPAVDQFIATLTVDAGFEQASDSVEVDLGQPQSVLEIPTLSQLGLVALAFALAGCGALVLRRRYA